MRMVRQPTTFNLHNNSNNNSKVKTYLVQTTVDKRVLRVVRVSKKRYQMMKATRNQLLVTLAVSITFVGVSSSVQTPSAQGLSTHADCATTRSIMKTNSTQRRIIS